MWAALVMQAALQAEGGGFACTVSHSEGPACFYLQLSAAGVQQEAQLRQQATASCSVSPPNTGAFLPGPRELCMAKGSASPHHPLEPALITPYWSL